MNTIHDLPDLLRRALVLGALPAALALLTLPGCGNLTAGGLVGETSVTVSGDAPDAASATSAPNAAPVAGTAALQDDQAEGEIEVEFRLFLLPALGGRPVELSEDPVRVRVDLRGRQEADAVRRMVPAQRYGDLRIVFTEIKAEVDRGLLVDGRDVTGEIRVELEDGQITVERSLPLDLGDGESAELLLDLNTQSWLRAVDPDLRRVARQIFSESIGVRIR